MKKANKSREKKAPKKLKRKAAQAELTALAEQFATIADRLERAVDRLAPVRQSHSNRHDNDDPEIGGRDE